MTEPTRQPPIIPQKRPRAVYPPKQRASHSAAPEHLARYPLRDGSDELQDVDESPEQT